MIFISGTKEIQLENTAVAIGKFDGLHLGHQALIRKINSYKSRGMASVMLTFNYHPASHIKGEDQKLIYTSKERQILVKHLGVDILIEYPFTQETAGMDAPIFLKDVLVNHLGAQFIVVGEDFRFGRDRRGNTDLVQGMSLPLGYSAHICSKVSQILNQGGKSYEVQVSSTMVRTAITEGDIETANLLLGHPYTIIDTVVHGREIGRTIGMPTANLEPSEVKLLPPNGVYASETVVNRRKYPSITNIGYNPTIGQAQVRRVETYVLDFEGNLYGKQIEVELHRFVRSEQKFGSIEELKKQMYLDKEMVKKELQK